MDISRNHILQWIKGLTDKQLVEFFYESTQNRHIYSGEENYVLSHLVLANATKTKNDNDENWGRWKLEILCSHDPKHYPDGFDDNGALCQFSSCCEQTTVSYVKNAICPICGQKVYGT